MERRDEIILNEMVAMMRQSASANRARPLTLADINDALVKFIEGHDTYVVFWTEGETERRLVIRWCGREDDREFRGNAAYVEDFATALVLRVACRADDNMAPDVEVVEMALAQSSGKPLIEAEFEMVFDADQRA
ncbi:hypothetical protein [Bradyrhizobium sp. I1.14.4]|uniref:hypothetical protein n=1 Tax=unclassified Bradyrhizobium TaxID=2631580 RepID=UPI003D232997